ncbi:MAG TPA: efflux RND transporter periplasmic adaptor subunit, partial [Polyangia bacterium]
ERELAAQRVSSAREEELAQASALSESAEVRAATERLRAFGLGAGDLSQLAHGGTGGRVPLRAPIAGTVVARAIALGQAVERGTDAFQIVDLSRLWVLLDVHEKDLGRVHVGQKVELTTDSGGGVLAAEVGYVSPIVDDKTRTAHVRIAFDNRAGALRPGQYVTARLLGDPAHATGKVLVVPRRCVQRVEGKLVAFVRGADGAFERRTVEAGAAAGELIEVRAGLTEGEEVASDGAFLLKSELLR